MDSHATAGILVKAGPTREVIAAALVQLGFSLVDLSQSAGIASVACDLVVIDEFNADSFLNPAAKKRTVNEDLPPPVVLLRRAGSPANAVRDLNFDGILELPLAAEMVQSRIRDIVHAHRAVAQRCLPLLQELEMVRRVMLSVTSGITIADATLPNLPLMYVNPAFEKMTGYSFEEVRGRNCRFLQAGDTDQPELELVRAAIREQTDAVAVLRNYRKDGTPFWNELYFSPLRDLDGRVTHFVGIQGDVTLRIELQQRLSFLADHDYLTDLANRRLLLDRLQQAILRASRQGLFVALLFFDLDDFKQVNDLFGHEAGDALLRVVAKRLQGEVRDCDTVARLGGDEFVVMIPDLVDEQEIPALIDRLEQHLSRTVVIREETIHPSVSIGWSLYPRDGRDADELIKAADFAMYADKHESRRTQQQAETTDFEDTEIAD